MSDCCTPKVYRQIFSEKNAVGEEKRYRSKGLDGTSRRILDSIRDGGFEGKTLLEVGGGIGAIEIELLKAGMARAVNVELTPTYEAAAGELLVEAGLSNRVERRVMDFAEVGADVDPGVRAKPCTGRDHGALAVERQRDWARFETVQEVVQIVLTERLLKEE